ncbi:Putative FAD dependent oxidoreductase, rieske [2Fe-2S] iron-sulfur domain, yhfW Rieske [Septoria linicola]|uniref:FAD dependent oxidoreductase, rieske [2Fe-2S] iron-sulfur domain, yhfW Rieske n=1 Tax=Septoria linicola TaxID=215465 RepID=A0A9Q9EMW1_9PEZI|nr:Putative FAD dependent oxidoreductase, rieske [2Fe-2S] iron-sulfur domain, yhfW Rieske [Septoria linicola]
MPRPRPPSLFDNRPQFPKLDKDLETDVVVVGSGISGIQAAYDLVTRSYNVVMLEARDVLSGETGRTTGHLASALDDGYANIVVKHGKAGAEIAARSHDWAIERVGEIAQKHQIDCEYRKLRGIQVSQYDISKYPKEHQQEIDELKEEVAKAKGCGLDVTFQEGYKVKGWDGEPDQRDAAIFNNQATFHPTKYLNALLKWLDKQPNFKCYTHTRVSDTQEKEFGIGPIGNKHSVEVKTYEGHTVTAKNVVMATCVPLQKLSVIAEMEYMRTYALAIKVPKNYIEDVLLYDEAEAYKYVRFTEADAENDYLVIGGCDHKVGQEEPTGRFQELETWVRERFTKAGSVDYAWSGQVFEPMDYVAFIGRDPGTQHTWIITGDSGNGLTHGVIAGEILAAEIEGKGHPWSALYKPDRVVSLLKQAKEIISHDVQINSQYKRFLQTDIEDIADLPNGEGGVLNAGLKAPLAVYKEDDGTVHKFSALCPHMHGVVCWNRTEKSWDCPIHGSRFSKDGINVMGPAKANMAPADAETKKFLFGTGKAGEKTST